MIDEKLEFALSQYADGTLPPSHRAALEARIASDPSLSAVVAEYQRLGSAFQNMSPLPAIDWDRFASHVSAAVAEQDVGSNSVRIYAMPWVRRAAGFAVAACLAIVIGIHFQNHSDRTMPAPVFGELAVAGPSAETPAGAVVEEISIGPSPAVALDDSNFRYGDSGVVSQPQRVVIASSDAPVQDTSATPY